MGAAAYADATYVILNKLEGYSNKENCRKIFKHIWSFPFLMWPVVVKLKCSYFRSQGA
jgi:hypothetical protein